MSAGDLTQILVIIVGFGALFGGVIGAMYSAIGLFVTRYSIKKLHKSINKDKGDEE